MEKSYDFYIGDILFPITPKKINIKIKNQNETIKLLNGEEYNLLNKPGLTEYSFEARLPAENYPAVNQFIEPFEIISKLNKLKNFKDKKEGIFNFIIIRYGNGLRNSTNTLATLEDYEILEDSDNGKDIIISLKIKRYIPIATEVLDTKQAGENKLVATVNKVMQLPIPPTTTVNVMAGMTASMVAKKYLGDSALYKQVLGKNGLVDNLLTKSKELFI